MATTTNYGWTTPDDTALVKDGAAAIRTLGSSVDTTTKNLNPSTTLGDIEYRSSTANTNTRLGIGTTGQLLTVVGGVPAWAAPAGGGGKVLQVVNATYATETTVSTTSFTDTGLSASITPSSATSKILVIASQHIFSTKDSGEAGSFLRLVRGATTIFTLNDSGGLAVFVKAGVSTNLRVSGFCPVVYLDSPSTTSATTYKLQGAPPSTSLSGTAVYQANSSASSITLMEIGA